MSQIKRRKKRSDKNNGKQLRKDEKNKSKLKKEKLAVDTETTGLNPWTGDRPFMVQIFFENGEAEVYEWPVNPFTRMPLIPRKDKQYLRELLNDPKYVKGFWNCKFDLFMLESIGIEVTLKDCDGNRLVEEVSWMARAVNNMEFSFKLKPLAKKYLDIPADDEKELKTSVGKARLLGRKLGWKLATAKSHGTSGKDSHTMADYWTPAAAHRVIDEVKAAYPKDYKKRLSCVDANACSVYGITDVERTMGLWVMYEEAMNDLDLWSSYNIEMDLLPVTMSMERDGVTIGKRAIKKANKQCEELAAKCYKILVDATGNPDFNPNSPQQVVDMLYGGKPLNLKCLVKTDKGNPSTNAEALQPYFDNPLVRALMSFKSNTKAMNTFFSKYDRLSTPSEDNTKIVVHPGFNQCGTVTNRYTCVSPNLQQVSSPESSSSKGREFLIDIRRIFQPRNGYVWLAPDYSQVEVIVFASVFKVETMLEAVRNGQDIHSATTDGIYKNIDSQVTANAVEHVMSDALASGTFDWRDVGSDIVTVGLDILENDFDCNMAPFEKSYGLKNFRKTAKAVTFTKIFGGGPGALMSWLPGISWDEAVSILNQYDESFPEMLEAQAAFEILARKQGYVLNAWGQRMGVDRWAVYKILNHLIQSSAAGLMKRGMIKCDKYIKSKTTDGRIAMTVHDEIIFELKKQEVTKRLMRGICSRMSDHEGAFSVPTPVDMDIIYNNWSKKTGVEL